MNIGVSEPRIDALFSLLVPRTAVFVITLEERGLLLKLVCLASVACVAVVRSGKNLASSTNAGCVKYHVSADERSKATSRL